MQVLKLLQPNLSQLSNGGIIIMSPLVLCVSDRNTTGMQGQGFVMSSQSMMPAYNPYRESCFVSCSYWPGSPFFQLAPVYASRVVLQCL